MLPPPPPPFQSRHDDSHAHGNDHSLNSRQNNWRTTPPTNTIYAPEPSSSLWNDRFRDQSFLYRQQDVSAYQVPPMHQDSGVNPSIVYPSASGGVLGTAQEPAFQPLHALPLPLQPQHLESVPQANQLQPEQRDSQQPQYTDTEWDKHRLKIKEIYLDQNKSLEKTMEIMLTEFDFRPSLVP
jgi:Clr5 domain